MVVLHSSDSNRHAETDGEESRLKKRNSSRNPGNYKVRGASATMIIREQDIPRSACSCKFMEQMKALLRIWEELVNYGSTADTPISRCDSPP